MSDQSTGSASGGAHEPSMEDILASIRKMIADDDVQTVNAGESAADTVSSKTDALEPTALVEPVVSTEMDVESVLDVADTAEPQSLETPADSEAVFSAFESDFNLEDDLTIPETQDTSLKSDSFPTDADEMIDIDDLIAEVESRASEDLTEQFTADLTPESSVTGDSDIELVKALMADLTEDTVDADGTDFTDEAKDQELDHILGEISDIEMNDDLAVEFDMDGVGDEDFNSLLQIAQDAKADASAAAAVTAASPLVAKPALKETRPIPKPEKAVTPTPSVTKNAEAQIETKVEKKKQETPDMPNAAEDQSILDEDTEVATMSAFASLSQVVETKTVEQDSGPAIGDLVKEALKPMLKDWLDKNLKGIVERSVAKEIKRLTDTK